MRAKHWICGLAITLGISALPAHAAEPGISCAVTAAPNPSFVPPPPYPPWPYGNAEHFLYGTPGLWTLVLTRWEFGSSQGNNLAFHSVHYDWKRDRSPQVPMTVEAKRLDGPAPLVRADHVRGVGPPTREGEEPDPSKGGAMLASLQIPTTGCWEITAQYTPSTGIAEKLSYTIFVEPWR